MGRLIFINYEVCGISVKMIDKEIWCWMIRKELSLNIQTLILENLYTLYTRVSFSQIAYFIIIILIPCTSNLKPIINEDYG